MIINNNKENNDEAIAIAIDTTTTEEMHQHHPATVAVATCQLDHTVQLGHHRDRIIDLR